MQPISTAHLSQILQEELRNIPKDIVHNLVESMSQRVAAVIAKDLSQT